MIFRSIVGIAKMTNTEKLNRFNSKRSHEVLQELMKTIDRVRKTTNTAEQNRTDIEAAKDKWQYKRMQLQHQNMLGIYDSQSWYKWYATSVYCHIEAGQIKVNHIDPIDDYQTLDNDLAFAAFAVAFPCSRIIFIPMNEDIRNQHLENGLLCPVLYKSASHGKGMRLIQKGKHLMGMQKFNSTNRPKISK